MSHNIVRHPDMPRAIFHFMWQKISSGHPIRAIVKNMAKNGDHYWVITDFKIEKGEDGTNNHLAKRRPAPKKLVQHFEPIYKKMIELEELGITPEKGMEDSLNYLKRLLTKSDKSYDEYIDDIVEQSFMGKLFGKLFG